MPLIDLPQLGKEVPITLTLPEDTVTNLKLYARFIAANHESAISAITNECIRRTLAQDQEFSNWKSHLKSKRGGSRPRPTKTPTAPAAPKTGDL